MIRLISIILFSVAIIISSIITSCDNSAQVLNSLTFPEEGEVSFIQHVRPFLMVRCANAGCHSEEHVAGGRRMIEYHHLFESPGNLGFVIPGNAKGSLFYQVLDGTNPHLLNLRLIEVQENHRQGIERWINSGARLN